MAKLPTPIQKRDILYGVKKTSVEELKSLANEFYQSGWLSDCLDFSSFAGAKDLLLKVKKDAQEQGNTFLFLKASRLLGENEVVNSEIVQCAEKAESLGLFRYAIMGFEKAGRLDKVEEIRSTRISQDGDVKYESQNQVFIPEHSEDLEGSELDESS